MATNPIITIRSFQIPVIDLTIPPNTFLYSHNSNLVGFFYDNFEMSWVDIIVSAKNENVKFDVIQFITGLNFFDAIQYFYEHKNSVTERFEKDIYETTEDDRFYHKFGGQWKAEIPLTENGERVTGLAIMIRCFYYPTQTNQKEIALLQLKTFVRDYML